MSAWKHWRRRDCRRKSSRSTPWRCFTRWANANLLATDDNRNVLVMLGPATADVIVYSRGVILAVRSIVLGADSESILREELQRTFVAAEAGQPQRARGSVIFLTQDEPSKLFAERVANGLNTAAAFLTNGAVPSPGLSLCLECAGSGAPPLNLLPDEWRQKRQTAAFRHHLIRGAITLAVVYAAALAVFLTFLVLRNSRLYRLDNEINKRQAEFHKAKSLQSELLAMSKQLDMKYSALEVLRQVAVLLPDNVKLTSFVYKKDLAVTIKGQAPTPALALDFQSRLEKCDLFSKVEAERSATEAGGLTKFGLTCTLKSRHGGNALIFYGCHETRAQPAGDHHYGDHPWRQFFSWSGRCCGIGGQQATGSRRSNSNSP